MDKVGPSPTTLLAAYIVPSAVWRVWMAEFYGPPLKAHSVSFCVVLLAYDGAGRCLCCWTLLA